jgi:hypothetical protein
LTGFVLFKPMILNSLNNVPRFLAEQEKSFAGAGLAQLLTVHSQTYPQLLGISRRKPDF